MKKIILIDACMRGDDSRTRKLTQGIVSAIDKDNSIKVIDLSSLNLSAYTRTNNPTNQPIEERFINLSKEIANSDGIIISAPFWDMSFPSLLKVFLEKLSIAEVMFIDNKKTCVGISNIPFMFLITTRGMDIPDDSELEQFSPYLRALCHLWGIQKFDQVSAYNLDYSTPQEIEEKINHSIEIGIEKLNKLM